MGNRFASPPHRLASVDALRGCTVAAMLLVNDPGDWGHVFWPLDHARWNGCTPTDLIFPAFLFIVGVSIALGILPRLERGTDRTKLRNAAVWRALRIVGLGLLINILAAWWMPGRHMRFEGVLQRIGVCYVAAALLAIYTRPRTWSLVIVTLLAAYTGTLLAGGTLAPWNNIVSRTDTAVFGHDVWMVNPVTGQGHDPEGLLSTLPAEVTTLLGLWAGVWLRERRVRRLLGAALLAPAAGWLWSLWIPLNKNLWTPSFTLWSTGWAALALIAFHVAVDRGNWPAWGRRFGVNAIAAYAGSELMQIVLPGLGIQKPIYDRGFARWLAPLAGPYVASLAFAIAFVVLWWLIVWIMDRRGWYLKI